MRRTNYRVTVISTYDGRSTAMEDKKLIEKIRKELLSIQNQINECSEKREKLVVDYTRKLLDFEVVDLEAAKAELIPKKGH